MDEQILDENFFIREKIYSANTSQYEKYSTLVLGKASLFELIKYELINFIFGPLPGALGLFLRKKFYPLLFKKIGKNVIFGKNLTIRNSENIVIGNNVVIDDYAFLDGRGAINDKVMIDDNTIIGRNVIIHSKVGPIHIGNHCNIGAHTIITAQGGVRIGNWVQIAGGCKISGGLFKYNQNKLDGVPFDRYTKGQIVIKDKCIIGGSSSIIDGVTIGKCSMVGTGSVVTNSIPDFSIYSSRPGFIIGKTWTDKPDDTL